MNKKYTLLFIALLLIGTYSCKKDTSEKKPETEANTIVGEWRYDYIMYENYASDKLINTYTVNYDKNNPDYAVFNTDGTGVFKKAVDISTKFSYSASGSLLNFTNVSTLSNDNWIPLRDFSYKVIKVSANELYYTSELTVASPSIYDRYVAHIHLVR